jgi:protein TonB
VAAAILRTIVKKQATPGLYKPPLSRSAQFGILVAVIFCHIGGGYALTLIEPPGLLVGDTAPLEVSFVTPDAPAEQEIPPPPEDTPPPEIPPPDVEAMIAPPDELPPPEFPVEPPPKPEPPKPPPPRPVPRPAQRPVTPAPPAEAQASSAPVQTAARSPGPQTLTAAQVGYLTRPSPIYPMRSKRAGDQGTVMVRVLVDATGRPSQVVLQASSGHPELDESALSAVRAARFRPFMDAGAAQAVWVLCPIGFALQ